MESTPERPSGLQFETATPQAGSTEATGVTCAVCQRTIADEYFDVNGKSVCATCRGALETHAETPPGSAPLIRAGLMGLVAAVLGGVLYYGVIAITNFEIGIVAIAIGYMVGYAMRMGTGGRGGRRFQVLAVVLTYWAVGLAYTPFALRAGDDPKAAQQDAIKTDATVTVTGGAETASRPAAPPGIGRVLLVIAFITFTLPIFVVMGSMPGGILSAAIIGFGMRQAWVMTARPEFQISGPYRIGGGAAGAGGGML